MKKFLIFLLLLIIIAGIFFGYARFVEPNMLTLTKVKIGDGPNMKIAYFSDTHFGELYKSENIERVVEKINGQEPDLVVFGGDFFDNYYRDKADLNIDYFVSWLKKIDGEKIAIWGNHDCGGGAEFIYKEMMERGGFTVLKNEILYLKEYDINVVGYDDYLLGHKDPNLYNLSTGTYNLLLTHEPDIIANVQTDTKGLAIGGHSHGGQINIPYFTEKILPSGARKFYNGLYTPTETGSETKLFVSSGIGVTVYPMRFLNVPEVVLLKLGGD